MLSRGYTEAEVLKYIAHHLLDSKQYVLPQAERADVVVRYEIPDWDAAGRGGDHHPPPAARGGALRPTTGASSTTSRELVEPQLGDDEARIVLPAHLPEDRVDAWARGSSPTGTTPERVGVFLDERERPGGVRT